MLGLFISKYYFMFSYNIHVVKIIFDVTRVSELL